MASRALIASIWFGPLPEWFFLWLRSVRANLAFDWLLICDQPPTGKLPDNLRVVQMTSDQLAALATDKLHAPIRLAFPYKVCDLRPTLGVVLADYFQGYAFYGQTDLDVIYGMLDSRITPAVLDACDIVSPHEHAAGHLCLFRNCDEINRLYETFPAWRELINSEQAESFDEKINRNHPMVDRGPIRFGYLPEACGWRVRPKDTKATTEAMRLHGIDVESARKWPTVYHYVDGRIFDGYGREYLYLHFMVWRGGKWGERWGGGQWTGLPKLIQAPRTTKNWTISESGFSAYTAPTVIEEREPVNFLWVGGELSPMERMSMRSFLAMGHQPILWHYDPVTGVPPGVELRDASSIIPRDRVFRYVHGGWGTGSFAGFSDIFRYRVLYEHGGWYADTDVTLIRPLPPAVYAFPRHEIGLVGNLMRVPPKSDLMRNCYQRAAALVNPYNQDWLLPIRILVDEVVTQKLQHAISHCLCLQDWDVVRGLLLNSRDLPESFHAVHWANEMWRHNNYNKCDVSPRNAYTNALRRYRVIDTNGVLL